jgi:hypothetical protein
LIALALSALQEVVPRRDVRPKFDVLERAHIIHAMICNTQQKALWAAGG